MAQYHPSMSGSHDSYYDPSDGERYPHRWGYTDTRLEFDGERSVRVTGSRYQLSGYSMPDFLPFVESILGVPVRREAMAELSAEVDVPAPRRNEAFVDGLGKFLSADQISEEARDRLVHSHGQLSVDEIYNILKGESPARVADLVVYPASEADVHSLVELGNEHGVCLVPYGGGTNVSGALACPREENRTIVSVDMRRMKKIVWLDEDNHFACIEAGISGKELERELGARGYTTGHDPDSIELSTLGGWISTNASGMKKNRYGNIEDIVLEATLVTPTGDIETRSVTPRNSIGIAPRAFLFGSEGNLGIITKAVLKVHPLPDTREYGSLVFKSLKDGVEFLRALRATGALPASIRLVNNTEFRFGQALKPAPASAFEGLKRKFQRWMLLNVLGFDGATMAACTIVMEGSREEVRHQQSTIFGMAGRFGGKSAGATNGKRGYMLTFGIAYIRDFFNRFDILGETFETSVPWSRIFDVTGAVEKVLADQCRVHGVPGKPYLSYRVTQTYHTGVCIYFTMGLSAKGLEKPGEVYHAIEADLRQAILDNGGSLSHHHGIGKIRKKYLDQVQTPLSSAMVREVKRAVDPNNVFGIRNGVFDDAP